MVVVNLGRLTFVNTPDGRDNLLLVLPEFALEYVNLSVATRYSLFCSIRILQNAAVLYSHRLLHASDSIDVPNMESRQCSDQPER